MKIGNLNIKGYAALAPMAGVADRAMREMCINYGAAYTVGELTSAKGVSLGDTKSHSLLSCSDKERPFGSQIFGNDPAVMAEAAKKAMLFKPDFIDINMGCPAPKVAISSGGGSALMKDEVLAGKIVRAVSDAVPVPVTVKMRTGWDNEHKNAVTLAKICEENGAAAITVHGRTRSDMYASTVDIETIKEVKKAVTVPVIANGDIKDGKSAAEMMERTNCDFLMVGRAATGNPWIFAQINSWLGHEVAMPSPSLSERLTVMLGQVKLMEQYKDSRVCYLEARKQCAFYMRGLKGAAELRRACGTINNFDDCVNLCRLAMTLNPER